MGDVTMSKLIYVADNDIENRQMIQSCLREGGYQVTCFESNNALFAAFQQKKCDLTILDASMSGNDGFMIGAKIRQVSSRPIIMLIERDSEDDYVFSISLGFDACLKKPFSPAVLSAHVRTLLIKAELHKAELSKAFQPNQESTVITYADITIYPDKRRIYCNNKELALTNTEFSVLTFILKNQDRSISRSELLSEIWMKGNHVNSRATDDTIKRLRRKLNKAGSLLSIDTVWGYGFRLGVKLEADAT